MSKTKYHVERISKYYNVWGIFSDKSKSKGKRRGVYGTYSSKESAEQVCRMYNDAGQTLSPTSTITW